MKQITLNEKQLKLLEECRELRKKLKPDRNNTDAELIELAFVVFKWYQEEDLKLREEGY